MTLQRLTGTICATFIVNCARIAFAITWTTLDYPGASLTDVWGIDGNHVVGSYHADGGPYGGFLFDGTTFTDLRYPGASITEAYGIDGNYIVGTLADGHGWHGFLYDGDDWTTIDHPLGDPSFWGTVPSDVSGNTIVGY